MGCGWMGGLEGGGGFWGEVVETPVVGLSIARLPIEGPLMRPLSIERLS